MQHKYRVYTLSLLAAFIIAAIICQYKGDAWEQRIREALYHISSDSIRVFSHTITDSTGVPYVQYARENGIAGGTRYNATIVANYAIDYYNRFTNTHDSSLLPKFKSCISWLTHNMTLKDNYAFYYFNWQQAWYPSVKYPFTSGMASGRSIEAFCCAFVLFRDSSFLSDARSLLRGYYLPIQGSGFTYKDPEGWWYEEFADSNARGPHILDGHIFALQGIQQFWQITNDDSALFLIKMGLAALKHELPGYDAGEGNIYYDVFKKTADLHYREVLSQQMLELWQSTGDSIFYQYHQKWIAPLKQPYLVKIFRDRNRSGILLYLLLTSLITLVMIAGCKIIYPKNKPAGDNPIR